MIDSEDEQPEVPEAVAAALTEWSVTETRAAWDAWEVYGPRFLEGAEDVPEYAEHVNIVPINVRRTARLHGCGVDGPCGRRPGDCSGGGRPR